MKIKDIINNINTSELIYGNSSRHAIITHNGEFHADEVFAVALLLYFNEVPPNILIVRTRDKEVFEAFKSDRRVFILDVFEHFDKKICFDHHQDLHLESTVLMILNYLKQNNLKAAKYYSALLSICTGINSIDVNKNNILDKIYFDFDLNNLYNISDIIKLFNNSDPYNETKQKIAFSKAVKFAMGIIDLIVSKERSNTVHIKNLKNVLTLDKNVGLLDSFIPKDVWVNYTQFDYFISKRDNNEYCIISRNSNLFPISDKVKELDGFVFLHQSKFIAVFDGLENIKKCVEFL